MSPALRRLLGPGLAALFRIALGIIFIAAAWPKLIAPAAFAEKIAHYHILPYQALHLGAITLPWIELLSGLALVLGVAIRPNLLVVGALLTLFIGAISSALARGLDISCGCFSLTETSASMGKMTLYWDIIWLAMTLHALVFDRGYLSLGRLRRTNAKGPSNTKAG